MKSASHALKLFIGVSIILTVQAVFDNSISPETDALGNLINKLGADQPLAQSAPAGRDGAAGSNRVFDSNGGPSGNRGPGSGNGNDNGNCKGNCAGNNLGNENGNRNTGTNNGNGNGNCHGTCMGNFNGNENGNDNINSNNNGNKNGNCVGNCFHNKLGNTNGNGNKNTDNNGNKNGNCRGNCFHFSSGNKNSDENCVGNCIPTEIPNFNVPASRPGTDFKQSKLNCEWAGYTYYTTPGKLCTETHRYRPDGHKSKFVCQPGTVFDVDVCACNHWYYVDVVTTCRSGFGHWEQRP